MKIIYFKVFVCVALATCTQGQFTKLQKENYLRDFRKLWNNAYLPSNLTKYVSRACSGVMNKFNDDLAASDLYALSMVDSWGKSNDGGYYGDPHIFGAYDQCLRAASPDEIIRGKYCVIGQFNPGIKHDVNRFGNPFKGDGIANGHSLEQPIIWRGPQDVNKLIKDFSQDFLRPRNRLSKRLKNSKVNISTNFSKEGTSRMGQLPLPPGFDYRTYATCIPHNCTKIDLESSLHHSGHSVWVDRCVEPEMDTSMDDLDGGFITFVCVIGILMLAGTAVGMQKKGNLANGPYGLLQPFDISANMKKLFAIHTKSVPGNITCLHGMRVMSMCWVIWGHQNLYTFGSLANSRNLYMLDTVLFSILWNADVSVDSFFFMSGLLVCYSVMREMKKNGRINIVMYYIHRILRLTPPIAVTVWFMCTVHRFSIRGPATYSYSPDPVGMAYYCRDVGWRDIFYVSTVDFDDGTMQGVKGCLGQCWYTSVDMQLYALAPLVLLPLYYFKNGGRVWMYLVTLAAIWMRGWVTSNELDRKEGSNNWLYDNYMATWCRADSWLIGAWTGYYIVNKGKEKLTLKKWQNILGWTLAVVFGLIVMFGKYHGPDWHHGSGRTGHIIYEMFHRSIWCACLGWVTIACHYGYGGIVNDFLSHPSWQPFSRLTFGMYLIGINLTYDLTFANRTLIYFTNLNKIIETCGILFFCCIYAVLLSITIEGPIIGLEKMLLKRPGWSDVKKPSGNAGDQNPVASPAASGVGKTPPPGYIKHAETVNVPIGFSASVGGTESIELQQVFIGKQVTVEVQHHNVDPPSS